MKVENIVNKGEFVLLRSYPVLGGSSYVKSFKIISAKEDSILAICSDSILFLIIKESMKESLARVFRNTLGDLDLDLEGVSDKIKALGDLGILEERSLVRVSQIEFIEDRSGNKEKSRIEVYI